MMLPYDEEKYLAAQLVYLKIWRQLPENLKLVLPHHLTILLQGQWLWAPLTSGTMCYVTEWGQKKIEMLLSPHAEALLRAYAIQVLAEGKNDNHD